jgi:hypothetical protein
MLEVSPTIMINVGRFALESAVQPAFTSCAGRDDEVFRSKQPIAITSDALVSMPH